MRHLRKTWHEIPQSLNLLELEIYLRLFQVLWSDFLKNENKKPLWKRWKPPKKWAKRLNTAKRQKKFIEKWERNMENEKYRERQTTTVNIFNFTFFSIEMCVFESIWRHSLDKPSLYITFEHDSMICIIAFCILLFIFVFCCRIFKM